MNPSIQRQWNLRPDNRLFKAVVSAVVLLLFLWSATSVSMQNSQQSGISVAQNIILGIFHPDMGLLLNLTTQGVPFLLLETVCIAFLGTVVGAILAIPISFLSATNIVPKFIVVISRFIIMAIRTIPSLIYGLMFIRVTGPGPFAGLLTMSLCSIGMLSKMYVESIEDLDSGILESLDAAGCSFFQKIRYGILPQLIPNFLSIVLYRFDMNLRDAAVLGLVGAGGIGAPLIFAMNSYRWNQAGSVLVGLILLVLLVEVLSGKIRVKLMRG